MFSRPLKYISSRYWQTPFLGSILLAVTLLVAEEITFRARAHWPLCSTTCGRVFVAGIFIPVGNHYFQALASTLQFVAQVCDRLWLVPATDRAFAYITYMSRHMSPQCARVRHNARPHVVEQSGQCARALSDQTLRPLTLLRNCRKQPRKAPHQLPHPPPPTWEGPFPHVQCQGPHISQNQ